MSRYALLALLLCGVSNAIRVIVFLQGTSIEERQPLMYIAQTLAHRNHKVAAAKVIRSIVYLCTIHINPMLCLGSDYSRAEATGTTQATRCT